MSKVIDPAVVAHLMRPDIQQLSNQDLLKVFVNLAHQFSILLAQSDQSRDFKGLHAYMSLILQELEQRNKPF